MPPEKHVFRAGDAPSGGELRQQGGKTVFRAGGAKAEKRGKKPAAPAALPRPGRRSPPGRKLPPGRKPRPGP